MWWAEMYNYFSTILLFASFSCWSVFGRYLAPTHGEDDVRSADAMSFIDWKYQKGTEWVSEWVNVWEFAKGVYQITANRFIW